MSDQQQTSGPVPTSGLALVVIGISLTMGAMALDGLVRGLGQGAGIAMILIGVAVLSAHARRAKQGGPDGPGDGMWLPSRDEEQP